MPVYKTVLATLLFFQLFNCNAKTPVDSLALLLEQSEGKERVDLLNELSWELKYTDTDRAFQLCHESIKLGKSIDHLPGVAKGYYLLAVMHYFKTNYQKSLTVSEQSFVIAKKLNNSAELANICNLRGLIYFKKGEYDLALEEYGKTLAVSKILENSELNRTARANISLIYYRMGEYKKNILMQQELADEWIEDKDTASYYMIKNSIGDIQMKLGNYPEALSILLEVGAYEKAKNRLIQLVDNYNKTGALYIKLDLFDQAAEILKQALYLAQKEGYKKQVAFINQNLGTLYSEQEELEQSESYYQKALFIFDSLGVKSHGGIYNNLAALKIKSKNFKIAKSLINKSFELNQAAEMKAGIGSNYNNLGIIHLELNQLQKAEEYFLKAFDIWEQIGDIEEQQYAIDGLAQIYESKKDDKKYQYYKNLSRATEDSLINKAKLLEVNKLLVQDLYEKQKSRINSLNNELSSSNNKVTDLEQKHISNLKKIKIAGLLILFAILAGFFFVVRKSRTANRTIANEANVTVRTDKLRTSLSEKNKQLAILSLEAAQQDEFLKQLQTKLHKFSDISPQKEDFIKLEKALRSNNKNRDNWSNFVTYFDKMHNGFFDTIARRFPTITNKELRHCSIIRLRIPIYEASIILGISQESVHKARYRIRKKLELNSDTNLEDFICNI